VSDNLQVIAQNADGFALNAKQDAKQSIEVPSSIITNNEQVSDQIFSAWIGNSVQRSLNDEHAHALLSATGSQEVDQRAFSWGSHIQAGANIGSNSAWYVNFDQDGFQATGL
jgi:hypothetical protein